MVATDLLYRPIFHIIIEGHTLGIPNTFRLFTVAASASSPLVHRETNKKRDPRALSSRLPRPAQASAAQLSVGLSGLSSSTSGLTSGSPACSRAHVAAHTSSTAGMKASKESYLGGQR